MCSKFSPLLCALSIFSFAGICSAQLNDQTSTPIPLIGPIPYKSAADSPFPIGTNPNFYLEDFEDGQLNTLGISQPPVPAGITDPTWLGTIDGPGPNTSSVDADDGVIDGSGRGGHALRSGLGYTVFTDPAFTTFPVTFDFDKQQLGFLPTAFGVVWTDGPPGSQLLFRITDESGQTFNTDTVLGLGDGLRTGDSADDVFVGFVFPAGIASVEVEGGYFGDSIPGGAYIEIDHVQYGLLVPEPSTFLLAAFGSLILLGLGLIHIRKEKYQSCR